MSEAKYFNFPIQLIDGIFKYKIKALTDGLYYALYSHSLKLETEDQGKNSAYNKFVKSWSWYNVTGVDRDKFSRGKQLFDSIPEKSVKVGLNISIFWDYYKNEKTDFDIACLCAFLAMKSIIGEKPYCKMDNSYLLARMAGKSKAIEDKKELPPEVLYYVNEYQTVKIKNTLRLGWGLKHYSFHTRGFYVSFDENFNDTKLGQIAEKDRKSNKVNQLKEHDKDVRRQVKESLKPP